MVTHEIQCRRWHRPFPCESDPRGRNNSRPGYFAQFETCTVNHRSADTKRRCGKRHPKPSASLAKPKEPATAREMLLGCGITGGLIAGVIVMFVAFGWWAFVILPSALVALVVLVLIYDGLRMVRIQRRARQLGSTWAEVTSRAKQEGFNPLAWVNSETVRRQAAADNRHLHRFTPVLMSPSLESQRRVEEPRVVAGIEDQKASLLRQRAEIDTELARLAAAEQRGGPHG